MVQISRNSQMLWANCVEFAEFAGIYERSLPEQVPETQCKRVNRLYYHWFGSASGM